MERLMKADADTLLQIREIGPEVAGSVVRFFQQQENVATIMRLQKAGVSFEPAARQSGSALLGMTFVFTGTMQEYTRQKAALLVEKRGGTVASTVSDKTTYVVAGADPGSKLNKARSLGVKIISEDMFTSMLA
jgi:DNA ligase (NAD+)